MEYLHGLSYLMLTKDLRVKQWSIPTLFSVQRSLRS
jgi:hypothetical protein